MLVCFGGDGTILHASKAATRLNVPVLGVNIGTVGFIAELESSEIPMLRQIALGEYELERRSMLDVAVLRGGNVVQQESCLNDVGGNQGCGGPGDPAEGMLRRQCRPWSLAGTA